MKLTARSLASLAASTAGAALLTVAALTALARAPDQAARVATLKTSDAATTSLGNRSTPAGTILCRRDVQAATLDATRSLQSAGTGSGVAIRALEFGPLSRALPRGLSGAQMHLVVTGGEKSLAGFLRSASQARLPVALDVVEVRHLGGGALQAEFTGRLLCRDAA